MANGYPCPACGDEEADLFIVDRLELEGTSPADNSKAAYSCMYACQACIDDARLGNAGPAIMTADHTSTSSSENA